MPPETRNRRVVRHVRAHKRAYGIGAISIGAALVMFGDFLLGILGNLVASVIGPWFGVH